MKYTIVALILSLKTPLEKIDGIKNPYKGDNYPQDLHIHLKYDKSVLSNDINEIGFSFYTDKQEGEGIGISIQFKLGEQGEFVTVSHHYYLKDQKLYRTLVVPDSQKVVDRSKTGVEEYLNDKSTSIKEIEKRSDDILKNRILKDWVSVYSSRFSPTNWGDVEIVEKWEE